MLFRSPTSSTFGVGVVVMVDAVAPGHTQICTHIATLTV